MPAGKAAAVTTHLPRSWAPELQLLARVLGFDAGAASDARAIAATLGAEQWERFGDLVIDRHRLAPLVAGRLDGLDAPAPLRAAIAEEADYNALSALRQKAETLRLAAALRSRGAAITVLKGWPLAERLHGSAALRHGRDIDILVAPAALACAAELLEAEGFTGSAAAGTLPDTAAAGAADRDKEREFTRPDLDFSVELHWRTNEYAGWPSLADLPGAFERRSVDASGVEIGVPSVAGNLIYLSVHGAQHVFSRLKWLHDIAALMAGAEPGALTHGLAEAGRIGAGRIVRISVELARRVFAAPLPEAWPAPTWSERAVAGLVLAAIPAPDFATPRRSASFRRHALRLLMAETMAQRGAMVKEAALRLIEAPLGRG